MKKIQQFQNRVIRTATRHNEEDQHLTIVEMHKKYNVDAVNKRLYRLAKKVWDNLSSTNEN